MEQRTRKAPAMLVVFCLAAGLIGLAASSGLADESDSGACIACHSNLELMDEFGAKAAAAAAGVAG